jgi:hypothetical protein
MFRLLSCLACAVVFWTCASFAAPAPDEEVLRGEVDEKLTAMDREVQRLSGTGAKKEAEELSAQIGRLRELLKQDKPWPEHQDGLPEMHVVGVYEGDVHKNGNAQAEVTVVDRPIILVLVGHEQISWTLRLTKGVQLQSIIVSGARPQIVVNAPQGIRVESICGEGSEYFSAYKRDGEQYPKVVRRLREITGLEITTLVGSYAARQPLVVGPGNPEWKLQRLLTEMEPLFREATALERARQREGLRKLQFKAIHWSADERHGLPKAALADFTIEGPIAGTLEALPDRINRVAIDPRGPTHFGTVGHYGFAEIEPGRQGQKELVVGNGLPRLQWPSAVAFDTKRQRIVLATQFHVGRVAYTFEPEKKRWALLKSWQDRTLQSLTYSAEDDCLYGLSAAMGEDAPVVVHVLDPDGKLLRTIKPSKRIMSSHREVFGAPSQLIAVGGKLVMLVAPPVSEGRIAEGAMSCHVIDSKTGGVLYSSKLRLHEGTGGEVAADQLEVLWKKLGSDESVTADAAAQQLALAGDRAVGLIKKNLAPVKAVTPEQVGRLVELLDHDQARERDNATAELTRLGPAVGGQLRDALPESWSPERRARIEIVLRNIGLDMVRGAAGAEKMQDAELRREARAMRVLGLIGTPTAVNCLLDNARGPVGAVRTWHARAALREF